MEIKRYYSGTLKAVFLKSNGEWMILLQHYNLN